MSVVVYRGHLAENLHFGHILEICGKASDGEAKRFHIFLSTGDPTKDLATNIGFFMFVNFEKDMIILKKLLNNEWIDEESKAFNTQTLREAFNVYIVMAAEKFHIAINKEPLMTYKYGIRLNLLNFIEIDGDLAYIRQVDHRKYFPYTWPPIQVVEERLQFSNDAPMPFKAGHVMVIAAQLLGNEKGRFLIHLRNIWDMERQEFHLSVRFDTRVMVRNSKTKQDDEHYSFDNEELDSDFPFDDFHQPFKLAIGITKTAILFAKDGSQLFQFQLRTPNVLPFIGGLKMFGINGSEVRVNAVDHIHMEDALCTGFEDLSRCTSD